MDSSTVRAEEMTNIGTEPSADSSTAYGTFHRRDNPADANLPSATAENSGLDPISIASEDEWEKIKTEFNAHSKSAGPMGKVTSVFRRLPPHVGLIGVVVLVALAIIGFIIASGPGGPPNPDAGITKQGLKGLKTKVTPAAEPPLTAQQKQEVKKLAKAQAAQLAAVAEARNQKAQAKQEAQQAAQKAQAEQKARAQEQAELNALLSVRPTDNDQVKTAISGARSQQNALVYDQRRVEIAKQNLVPLENGVKAREAAFDAENQQYLSWQNKLKQDQAILNAVLSSKQSIAKHLAQLKILGRRESSSMPSLKANIFADEKKQADALQASQHYTELAKQAKEQLAETMRAEKDDTAAVTRERAYVAAQQTSAATAMRQSQSLMQRTSAIEEQIAQLTPVVNNLRTAYLHEQRQAIEDGLVNQDKRREDARTTLNKYIRERERIQQLPKTKAHAAELTKISKKLVKAQKYLGKLYSDEESDKEKLKDDVRARERKSALYIRFKNKNKILQQYKTQLSSLSTQSDEMRMQAQSTVNNAASAQQRAANTMATNKLLSNAEHRLRVKEKVFAKEAKVQAQEAHKWAARVAQAEGKVVNAKKELSSETMKGEQYLENAMSGQQKRKSLQLQVNNEQQAFNQEAMLRQADQNQLNQAEAQLEAAQAVVNDLQQTANLAKAEAWKADMSVKEARRNEMLQEQIKASPYLHPPAPKPTVQEAEAQQNAYTATANKIIQNAVQHQMAVAPQQPLSPSARLIQALQPSPGTPQAPTPLEQAATAGLPTQGRAASPP